MAVQLGHRLPVSVWLSSSAATPVVENRIKILRMRVGAFAEGSVPRRAQTQTMLNFRVRLACTSVFRAILRIGEKAIGKDLGILLHMASKMANWA